MVGVGVHDNWGLVGVRVNVSVMRRALVGVRTAVTVLTPVELSVVVPVSVLLSERVPLVLRVAVGVFVSVCDDDSEIDDDLLIVLAVDTLPELERETSSEVDIELDKLLSLVAE